jgi:hypothetical protein
MILFDLQAYTGLVVFLGKAALFFIGIAIALVLLLDKDELKQTLSALKISRA